MEPAVGPPGPGRRARAWTVLPLIATITAAVAAGARASPTQEMVFARLGSDDGLSQGTVNAIVQDAQGFMWFGTEDGLDRFDGYEIRHFSHRRDNTGSLPNNWIAARARSFRPRLGRHRWRWPGVA
jgi:Two component regulator propeller